MGKHDREVDIESGVFELANHTVQSVRQIADDLWTVTGYCSHDEEASTAMEAVVSYLRDLTCEVYGADPELIQFGVVQFVNEFDVEKFNVDADTVEGIARDYPPPVPPPRK